MNELRDILHGLIDRADEYQMRVIYQFLKAFLKNNAR